MSEYIIALDAMGGDNAPDAIVAGAVAALRRYGDIRILLAGPEARLNALLEDAGDVRGRVEILPAEDVIRARPGGDPACGGRDRHGRIADAGRAQKGQFLDGAGHDGRS